MVHDYLGHWRQRINAKRSDAPSPFRSHTRAAESPIIGWRHGGRRASKTSHQNHFF